MRRRRYVSRTSNPKVSFVFVPSPCPTGSATASPSTTRSVGPSSRVFVRAVLGWYRRRARRAGWADGHSGSVTVIQRFGSGLQLNVHSHALVLDGVFTEAADGTLRLHPAPAPTDLEVARFVATIQIALLVAPVLVFVSYLVGPAPIDLRFTYFEVVSVAIATFVANLVAQDGECNWLEGALLLAVYVVLGLAFYFLP